MAPWIGLIHIAISENLQAFGEISITYICKRIRSWLLNVMVAGLNPPASQLSHLAAFC